jgi:hypothetical protein
VQKEDLFLEKERTLKIIDLNSNIYIFRLHTLVGHKRRNKLKIKKKFLKI